MICWAMRNNSDTVKFCRTTDFTWICPNTARNCSTWPLSDLSATNAATRGHAAYTFVRCVQRWTREPGVQTVVARASRRRLARVLVARFAWARRPCLEVDISSERSGASPLSESGSAEGAHHINPAQRAGESNGRDQSAESAFHF